MSPRKAFNMPGLAASHAIIFNEDLRARFRKFMDAGELGEIINFFDRGSTNAASESFNAKIKEFRTQFRGVKDRAFFRFFHNLQYEAL